MPRASSREAGCIQRNPKKGIESRLISPTYLNRLVVVAFKEIPKRELRGARQRHLQRCLSGVGCIQRNPKKGIESQVGWLRRQPSPAQGCIQRNPKKGIESDFFLRHYFVKQFRCIKRNPKKGIERPKLPLYSFYNTSYELHSKKSQKGN